MSEPTVQRDVILFDIDGTLVDSTYHHALAWHRAFQQVGLAPPLWQVHRAIGMGGDKLVGHVTGEGVEDKHGDELRELWKKEFQQLLAEVQPLPGAADLVRQVAGQGYVVALASSGEKPFADAALDLLGIGDHVAVTTTASDAEQSKPEADILIASLDQVDGVSRSVLVGDTPYDVQAAAKIGLGCVTVLTGGFSRTELESAGAALVVASLEELGDLDWSEHLRTPRR